MYYHYFKINAVFPDADAEKLNHFLRRHSIVSVAEQFVTDGHNSFWSVRVCVAENTVTENQPPVQKSKRNSVDYREVLTPEVFSVYVRLRNLRKQMAEQQDVPAYAIFTNEQLAQMAQLQHPDFAALAQIEGIGEKRLERYGKEFLTLLQTDHG